MDEKYKDPDFIKWQLKLLEILAFAFYISPAILSLLAYEISKPQGVFFVLANETIKSQGVKNIDPFVGEILMVVALIDAFAGFLVMRVNPLKLKSILRRQYEKAQHPALIRFIIACAFFESITILGFVWFFLSGSTLNLTRAAVLSVLSILIARNTTHAAITSSPTHDASKYAFEQKVEPEETQDK